MYKELKAKQGRTLNRPHYQRRRLTPIQVARIRDLDAPALDVLAREFGVSRISIFYVKHYYTYKDLP